MQPEYPSLEAAFEPLEPQGLQEGARNGATADELNTFFERLSSLDNLRWTAEPSNARPAGASQREAKPAAAPVSVDPAGAQASRPAAGRKPSRRRGTPRPPRAERMQVLRSDDALDFPGGSEAAVAVDPGTGEAPGGRRLRRAAGMALMGLVLFGIGLGAGWAALKIPGNLQRAMPGLSKLIDQGHLAGGRTVAPQQAPATQESQAARAPADETADGGRVVAAAPPPPQPAATAKPARPATTEAPVSPPAAQPAPAAPQSAPAAPKPDPTEVASGPQYAIQVGACSSYACVEKYRTLLLRTVSARSIQVTAQPVASGTIQRIRVAPMDKAEAQRIREAIVATDPRLKDAYLVAVN